MIPHRALLLSLFLSLLSDLSTSRSEVADKCDTCRELVKKFKEGLIKTAKSNFGGGNTHWEEKNLGSYAFSETRFLEITENVCSSDGKEERKCHHMLEANEELLEQWWFKHYAKGVDIDLREYLCVKKMAVCCPKGTFGPQCKDCIGGRKRPCQGNGRCEGDGTRDGTGTCECNVGYREELCDECMDGFYEEIKNQTHTICNACHPSCKLTCSEPGPIGCDECRDGWQLTDDKGCVDLDECEDVSMCGVNEFCTNTDGSYRCTACHVACSKCTGPSAKDCTDCTPKYFQSGTGCLPCHASCANSCVDDTPATCDECAGGWMLSEAGSCQDIDECLSGEGKCETDEYCINTVGNYKCSTCHPSCLTCLGPGLDGCTKCRPGFQRNELNQCTDVDECALPDSCPGDERTCLNTPGSFRCECQKGFVLRNDKCEIQTKDESTKSSSNQNIKSNSKKNLPPRKPNTSAPPTKKKPKQDHRMSVSRDDSVLYAGSLVGFSIVCGLLRRSVVVQTVVSGTFWGYLYWLTLQMERYIAKSTS